MMDINIERECSALGNLFHQIITDMKNGSPLWEDLISKATKLHASLKAAVIAVSAYLETFQKIADAATNARGATKEIGTDLTRICLRHKAVENRMKSFTCAIMDRLIMPLQEKLEDWKKALINLDKDHAKEYKKAKSELKKRSTDTLRLQKKKSRKGIGMPSHGLVHSQMTAGGHGNRIDEEAELDRLLESSAAIVQEKRISLEETERRAVRAALLEERGRFCHLARLLKPVLDEEIAMLMELTHLQEVSDQLERHALAPYDLPAASEQIIKDLKGRESTQWALATPPSSPSLSLGSRKSSMCSISSLTSSSSGSCKNHTSPSGHPWHRSLSQPLSNTIRNNYSQNRHYHLSTGSSRDSGFTSQDTLYKQPINEYQISNVSTQSNQNDSNCTANISNNNNQPPNATWPDLKDKTGQFDKQTEQQNLSVNERPHTISSAYEKGLHQRPALSVYTFQAPDLNNCCHSQPASPVSASNPQLNNVKLRKNSTGSTSRPPIPNRCSSLERRTSASSVIESSGTHRGKAKLPIPAHLTKELGSHQSTQQPMYVNMHELANLAANRAQEMQLPAASGRSIAGRVSNIDKSDVIVSVSKEKDDTSNEKCSMEIGTACTLPRRSSFQQNKPAPPARRTSTIICSSSSTNETTVEINVDNNNQQLTTEHSLSNVIVVDNNDSKLITDETDNLPPPPAFLLEGNSPISSPIPQRSVSVSETVRTLTELRHTPASPSFLRKAAAAAAAAATTQQSTRTIVEHTQRISLTESTGSTSGQGFMAVLNSKLANNSVNSSTSNSPKLLRKHIPTEQQLQMQPATQTNPRTPTKFIETLNAKLSIQKPHNQSQTFTQPFKLTNRSANIRRIMANRMPIIDQTQVRDSLMDQIRRGTSLRKTNGPINDRSAPQIY